MSPTQLHCAFASRMPRQTSLSVGYADFEPPSDEDEFDWDDCEGGPATDPEWDPFDDEDEDPEPEYGDFWSEPDDFDT